jgi:hypothetical protein
MKARSESRLGYTGEDHLLDKRRQITGITGGRGNWNRRWNKQAELEAGGCIRTVVGGNRTISQRIFGAAAARGTR